MKWDITFCQNGHLGYVRAQIHFSFSGNQHPPMPCRVADLGSLRLSCSDFPFSKAVLAVIEPERQRNLPMLRHCCPALPWGWPWLKGQSRTCFLAPFGHAPLQRPLAGVAPGRAQSRRQPLGPDLGKAWLKCLGSFLEARTIATAPAHSLVPSAQDHLMPFSPRLPFVISSAPFYSNTRGRISPAGNLAQCRALTDCLFIAFKQGLRPNFGMQISHFHKL